MIENINPLVGMTIYERLKPELAARASAITLPTGRDIFALFGGAAHSPAPTLEALIEQVSPLPPNTTIIGACEDGLHIFFDLADPRSGSLLVVGDRRSGKTRLAQSIAKAASMLNSPRKVRFAVVTPDMAAYDHLSAYPHCFRALPSYSNEAVELVVSMAELAEQRRTGRLPGAVMLLFIDNLAYFLNGLDSSILDLVSWLVQNGPESGVWTVATLDSEDLLEVDHNLLSRFGTRLVGRVSDPETAEYIGGGVPYPFETLKSGDQFCAFLSGEWINFWVPA